MDTPTIEYLLQSPQHICELHIKKRFPDFYETIKNIEANSFSEKLHIHFFGRTYCKYCGNKTKYKNFREGYHEYCGLSCRTKNTRDKARQTCLDRYGDPYYNNRKKAEQTSIQKYGVPSWNTTPEKIEKTKQTCLERYGYPCSFQNETVKNKFKQTCLERYGVEWYTETQTMVDKSKQTCLERYGVDSPAKLKWVREKMQNTCRVRYNHPHGPVGHSSKEDALVAWIKSNGFEVIQSHSNDSISEIDIFIPSLNIGFEFNGVYWHSNKHKDSKYHLNKTRACMENGIKLYHIWEHWNQLDVYEFILHVTKKQKSTKNFDRVFYKDNAIHIDINPELCLSKVKLKRRMYKSHIYYDSGIVIQ